MGATLFSAMLNSTFSFSNWRFLKGELRSLPFEFTALIATFSILSWEAMATLAASSSLCLDN